ncbi:MAG TPA: SCP2 sterol-binding domain-containing protein [Anaerolineaceae bacterium]|nr:SCP2 sterol-binding domain-containing protein [Anaerolineaceae bacterium]
MANEIRDFLARIPNPFQLEHLEDTKALVQFNVEGEGGGKWVADVHDNICEIREGTVEDPDLDIKGKIEDVNKLLAGELDPMKAYMTGKVKVIGNLMLGLKLLKAIKLA